MGRCVMAIRIWKSGMTSADSVRNDVKCTIHGWHGRESDEIQNTVCCSQDYVYSNLLNVCGVLLVS